MTPVQAGEKGASLNGRLNLYRFRQGWDMKTLERHRYCLEEGYHW